MPKSGFDTSADIQKLTRHKAGVKRGMIREAKRAAQNALDGANAAAPVDTGALKTAGYVIAREFNGIKSSGYDRSIVEAAGKNLEIENRGQAQEELVPPSEGSPGDARAWAAVHIPLDYADILIDGFHNVRSKTEVPPNDFFNPAVEAAEMRYDGDAQRMLDTEVRKVSG